MHDAFKQTALVYANRGWPIFPVHTVENGKCSCGRESCHSPGKHPVLSNGHKSGTTNKRDAELYAKFFVHRNIGFRTGAEAGIWVLDVDAKSGGLETLARLEAEHGELPKTMKVKTGGGGYHFYFAYPDQKVR